MKIYIVGATEEFNNRIQNALEDSGQKDVTVIVASRITAKELVKKAGDCEILVASPSGFETVSKDHITNLPNLKFITITSVGVDWLDVNAVKELGIVVSNEKGVNAEAVAEHCFGLVLDLAKRITEADRDIREKGEYRSSPYQGMELFGKTLGIIGVGNIGKRVARIARGFSMKMQGLNKSGKPVKGIDIVDLETLLKTSDIVVVTIPLTKDTENLLTEKEFDVIKPGAFVVSISREAIINKNAVLNALNTGKISGYGFDAEINTPIERDDPYLKHNRIVITPHSASMTREADKGYIDMTVENVTAFLNKNPIRVVS
ncbi:MAG: D-isomer specific 2-hydroxyacid dehydrogenase family protein [Candidatus Levyibacteriota bacterium]